MLFGIILLLNNSLIYYRYTYLTSYEHHVHEQHLSLQGNCDMYNDMHDDSRVDLAGFW